jgi:putative peptidoglycan lipid II flippase
VSTPGDLLRANATVAVGTLASRITGFVRFALVLWLVEGSLADAFNTANNVPNVLYELVLGGVLSASVIPLFTQFADTRDHESTSAVLSTALVALIPVTIVATAASWLIIRLYTLWPPKGINVDHFRSVATLFAYLLIPQIFFYGATFLLSALLNAHRRFVAAAWAPVVNNVLVILILGSLAGRVTKDRTLEAAHLNSNVVFVLGGASTLGIVAMTLFLLPAVRGTNVRLRFKPDRNHPAVQRIIKLSKWTIGYTIANQVSLYLMTVLARPGSVQLTIFQGAYLLISLPIGLFAASINTTFGPEMARARLARDRLGLIEHVSLGLRSLAALLLPVSAGLIAMARPLVSILLEHGQFFKGKNPALLAGTVAAFAVGLFALGGFLFVLRGFYAHNDTRTPFALNVVENVLAIVFAVVLVGRFGVAGLAWATSLAYIIALGLALASLSNKLRGIGLQRLLLSLSRLVLGAVVAGEVAWLISHLVGSDTGSGALLRVAAGVVFGGAAYIGTLAFLQAPELSAVRRLGR